MSKKSLLRGLTVLLLSAVLAITTVNPGRAEAASTYMAGKVRYIKNGNTVRVKTYVSGLGYRNFSVTLVEAKTGAVKSMKVKQNNKTTVKKFNKVTATYDVIYPTFTSDEVKKIKQAMSDSGSTRWMGFNAFAVNFETGKYINWYKFEDKDKEWFTMSTLTKNGSIVGIRINVSFWKAAGDTVAVGVAGRTISGLTSNTAGDVNYSKGSATFTKTSYYQKGSKKLSAFVKLK